VTLLGGGGARPALPGNERDVERGVAGGAAPSDAEIAGEPMDDIPF